MTKQEAIERARKLMALGESDNENEAALALGRAQELLARFEIEMADLGEDMTAGEEYTEESVATSSGRSMIHWKRILLGGLARPNGVAVFLNGPRVVLCGMPSDIARVRRLYVDCSAEILRLSSRECRGKGRSYGNSYRMGAASAVSNAARNAAREAQAAMRGKVTETALVVLDTRGRTADREMRQRHNLSCSRSYAGTVGGGGYAHGAQAGAGVYGRATGGRVSGGGRRLGSGQ